MVKLKLQDLDEGQGWNSEVCINTEREYKRFLTLKYLYPDQDIVPNKLVDTFWHQHILDTEKYAFDCQEVFGYFIHHYPYFGMRDTQDAQNLIDAFEETKILYQFHFSDDFIGQSVKCTSPKCRTACKPTKCK